MDKILLCASGILSGLLFAEVKDNYSSHNSYNSFGQTGLIQLPSAQIQNTGNVGVILNNSTIAQILTVTATPTSWLEASFYYRRTKDTSYTKKGNYLDKGLNVKVLLLEYNNISFSAGIDDVGGTGLQAKEYIVSSINTSNYRLTLGVGTGDFSGHRPYQNPISKLRERPASLFTSKSQTGSEIDFNSFFKGPIGIFAGIEYRPLFFPKLTFQLETNPFDYNNFLIGGTFSDKTRKLRKKKRNYNIGIHYNFRNNYSISLSQFKGDGFDITLSKKFNFNPKKTTINVRKVVAASNEQNKKFAFYEDILRNLEKDQLYLQAAELDSGNLKVAIVNNKYNSQEDVFAHTNKVTGDLAEIHELNISSLILTNLHSGIETGTIIGRVNSPCNPQAITQIEYYPASNESRNYAFKPTLSFPEIYNEIKPHYIYRYADPDRFFAGGLDIQLESEIKFSANTYITSTINYQAFNSFDRLIHKPYSNLPHVRTDFVLYARERGDFYLDALQLHSDMKIANDHYLKLTGGMFEMMFGGYGLEYYWKPFTRNLSIGFNVYNVKQRDFKQGLHFSKYNLTTGHSNIIYFHEDTGIQVDLSLGKYLAGDKGYTLDFSRTFKSHHKIGFYFTRTNISKIEYGEGSFDKGFYFEFPINFIKGISEIIIQPLTRDGGAKLKTSNSLISSLSYGAANEYNYFVGE